MRRRWQYVPEGVIEDPRMTKLKRLLLVGLAVVGMVMGLAPETANAVWQSSGWQCVDNGNCKYGQGKIRWDTAPSPDSIEVSWFGSTSRSCAGGPGQGSWRLVQAKTFNDATGVAVTATGTKPWRSNGECVTSPVHRTLGTNRSVSTSHRMPASTGGSSIRLLGGSATPPRQGSPKPATGNGQPSIRI